MSRVHGLHSPFDTLQICSWIALALLIVSFHVLSIPIARVVDLGTFIAFLFIFWLFLSLVITSVLYCSLKDPREIKLNVESRVAPVEDVKSSFRDCSYCSKLVISASRHCRLCCKCIPHFDHHCRWLNTCIGQVNYSAFLSVLATVNIFLAVQISFIIFCIYRGFDDSSIISRAFDQKNSSSLIVYQLMAFIYLLTLASALVPVAHLTVLHIYLCARGLTTYDWIMEGREKAKLQSQQSPIPLTTITMPTAATISLPSATLSSQSAQHVISIND